MAYLVVVMAYDSALISVPAQSLTRSRPPTRPAWPMTWRTIPTRCGNLKFLAYVNFAFPIFRVCLSRAAWGQP